MAVSAPPPPAVEIDDGVIEEARRRQWRRRRGIAAVLVAAVATAVLGLSLGDGNSPPANASFESALGGPVKLAFVHGRPRVNGQPFPISVRPSLQAGGVGLWVLAFGPDGCCAGGGANYPSATTPLWGDDTIATQPHVGPNGEIDFTLVEPEVAAVRVSGIGTFKPHAIPGLPPGARIVVFYRPPGSPGVIVPPGFPAGALPGARHHTPRAITLTPLDVQGHVIPSAQTPAENGLQLPIVYWQASNKTPRRASCALHSSARGVSIQWGEAATQIAPDKSVNGPAFLSCTNVWYTLPGKTFEVGLLLNAQRPGAPPAPLWGAVPVPGHPGLIQLPPVQFLQPPPPPGLLSTIEKNLRRHYGAARAKTIALRIVAEVRANRRMTLAPGAVAERTRGAWLLVEFGRLAQRLAFLKTLQLTRFDLTNGP